MAVQFRYTPSAPRDLKSWKKDHATRELEVIRAIQIEIERTFPKTEGAFTPEDLRGNLSGFSSRRINAKDRFVYRVLPDEQSVEVVQCRGHYGDR